VVAAAVGYGSGGGGAMPSNGRQRKPLWVLGRSFGRWESTGEGWRGEFTGDRPWRARWSGGSNGVGREEEHATLNRGAAGVTTA
jgi:hypothetical protein